MRIISAGGARLLRRSNLRLVSRVMLCGQRRPRHWSGAPPAMTMLAVVITYVAAPALAMDDQATYWRFDGRVEKRLTSLAPATEWATSAWIGDDSTKLRLQNSGVLDDAGRIHNEGGTRGIDKRLFYSPPLSDFSES